MAREASVVVVEPAAKEQVEEKKVSDMTKILEGDCRIKGSEEIGKSDKTKVEQPTEEKVGDKEDGGNSEDMKKGHEEAPRSSVLEEKDDTLVVADAEQIKDGETESKAEEGEKIKDETTNNAVVEQETFLVRKLEADKKETRVSDPLVEIDKVTEARSDIAAKPALASKTIEGKAEDPAEHVPDAPRELEKKDGAWAFDEVSGFKTSFMNIVVIPGELSVPVPVVSEMGYAPACQPPVDNDVPGNITEKYDNNADRFEEGSKNEETGPKMTQSLMYEPIMVSSMPITSTTMDETKPTDHNLVIKDVENVEKPEIMVEKHKETMPPTELNMKQKEEKIIKLEVVNKRTLGTLLIEEHKGEKNVQSKVAEEQKEEVNVETKIGKEQESRDLSSPADVVTQEQRDVGFAKKTVEVPLEKEKPSESVERLKDENATEDTALDKNPKNVDPEGQDWAATTINKPTEKEESMDGTTTRGPNKDDFENKIDEAKEIDSQDLTEVQNSEAPSKPKNLISKLRRSITKVKKAITGKSPSSKTISGE